MSTEKQITELRLKRTEAEQGGGQKRIDTDRKSVV